VGGDVRDLPAIAGEFLDTTRVVLVDAFDGGIELRV
jgi:hypothetical protein